jgi:hypothetical protein
VTTEAPEARSAEAPASSESAPRGRPTFGPPDAWVGAFLWATLQFPRAVLWQLREKELRKLAFAPALVTLLVGLGLFIAAVVSAGPLALWLLHHATAFSSGLAELTARVIVTAMLIVMAAGATWQLQGSISAAALQRMALYVQRVVEGEAPEPSLTAVQVVALAVKTLIPSLSRFLAFALSWLAAATLILVPVAGPVLVLVAQTAIGALFLSHGAIAGNRERLGLPRLLALRESAVVLGLALAFAPLILVPPLMLFTGGPVAIAGAMVAIGSRRRRTRKG